MIDENSVVFKKSVDEIMALSQQLLTAIDAGEWESVNTLEKSRNHLIKKTFTNDIAEPDKAVITESVEKIKSMDEKIIERIKQCQKDHRMALSELNSAAFGIKKYSEQQGLT